MCVWGGGVVVKSKLIIGFFPAENDGEKSVAIPHNRVLYNGFHKLQPF